MIKRGPIHWQDVATSNLLHWKHIASKYKNPNLTELHKQSGKSITTKRDFYNGTRYVVSLTGPPQIGSDRVPVCKLRFEEGIFTKSHSWWVATLRFKSRLLWRPHLPQAKHFPVEPANKISERMAELELFFNTHNSFGWVFSPPRQHWVAISPHLLITGVCAGAGLASRGSPHRLSHCQGFLH